MIKLNNSVEIKKKGSLTIIIISMEMTLDDYEKLDIGVNEYPLDAWTVWVLKYHDMDNPAFEVCNRGHRFAKKLTREEKSMVMDFIIEHGYYNYLKC